MKALSVLLAHSGYKDLVSTLCSTLCMYAIYICERTGWEKSPKI